MNLLNNTEINWDAVAAISNILVAISTFLAILVSLYLARSENKTKVLVKISTKYMLSLFNNSNVPYSYAVEGVNVGKIPVKLTDCTVELPNKNKMAFLGENRIVNLPVVLMPSESVECDLPFVDVNEKLREFGYIGKSKVCFYFSDSTGKRYKKKIKINL